MLATLILLWAVAIGLAVTAYFRPGDPFKHGMAFAHQHFLIMLPRVVLAILTAGFVAPIVPQELVSSWLGPASGLAGIAIGAVVGAALPAGPVVAFPLALVLFKAGVGVPQLIALLTAWSVYAAHRIIGYELPMMGWRFSVVRLTASLPLPILAGLVAWLATTIAPVATSP